MVLESSIVSKPVESQPTGDEPLCHFFKLPIELRISIYTEVVVHRHVLEIFRRGDGMEQIDEHDNTNRKCAIWRPCEPALLLTCRQIREEALPVFYGGNTFKSSIYDGCLWKFISWLTPEKRLVVKHLRLSPDTDLLYPAHRNPPQGSCVIKARLKLNRMKKWLEDNDISLRKGALQVFASPSDDVAPAWTASPEGKCGFSRCCGRSSGCEVVCFCFWSGCKRAEWQRIHCWD